MRPVVGVGVIGVHVFDGAENSVWIKRVIVLPDVILHHDVKELPPDVVSWSQTLVVVCKKKR